MLVQDGFLYLIVARHKLTVRELKFPSYSAPVSSCIHFRTLLSGLFPLGSVLNSGSSAHCSYPSSAQCSFPSSALLSAPLTLEKALKEAHIPYILACHMHIDADPGRWLKSRYGG
jgi:hypothetical protein